ncbi:hypothetical protein B0H17DRAFT_837954, partial [Mycena rosella]
RMPIEITVQIFTHFLPPYPETADIAGPGSPSFLARICRQWRDIAVSKPSLWRAVGVQLLANPEFVRGRNERQVQLLETWLGRSGNRALAITL